jgi:citrate synthase
MTINRHHGGAIENAMRMLLDAVARKREKGQDALTTARELAAEYRAAKKRFPGYGHRVHTADPRTKKLFAICEEEGVAGEYVEMAHAIRQAIKESIGKDLPMNVDGAIATVLCELDFAPEMGNGLFAISRVVGLTAHVFDEITAQKPMRRISPTAQEYNGPEERSL